MHKVVGYLIYATFDLLSFFNKTEVTTLTRTSFLIGYFIMDISLTLLVILFPSSAKNFTLWMSIVFCCFGVGHLIHNYYMCSSDSLKDSWKRESSRVKKCYKVLSLSISLSSTLLLFLVLLKFRNN